MNALEQEVICRNGLASQKQNSGSIREDRFSTRGLPVDRQFLTWRAQMEELADVSMPQEGREGGVFSVDARGYDLGRISLSMLQTDAFNFKRSLDHIRRTALDHWILTYRFNGEMFSRSGRRSIEAGPQSLTFSSLAYPFEGRTAGGRTISLFLQREELLSVADQLDRLNHIALQGMTAQIAIQFLISMSRLLPVTPVSDVPIFVETATIILKGFVDQAGSIDTNPARPIMALRLELVKRYIQENLSASTLEPDQICSAMKLSRRQLYYLFDQIGGVSTYIRSRRLIAVHNAITDAAETRPIHAVAALFGFHDAALFSRQFKAQFGYSPKDAREGKLCGFVPISLPPKTIGEWLGQVREAR